MFSLAPSYICLQFINSTRSRCRGAAEKEEEECDYIYNEDDHQSWTYKLIYSSVNPKRLLKMDLRVCRLTYFAILLTINPGGLFTQSLISFTKRDKRHVSSCSFNLPLPSYSATKASTHLLTRIKIRGFINLSTIN